MYIGISQNIYIYIDIYMYVYIYVRIYIYMCVYVFVSELLSLFINKQNPNASVITTTSRFPRLLLLVPIVSMYVLDGRILYDN